MPMNALDRMLSDAADVVDERLKENSVALAETIKALDEGMQPSVQRVLTIPGATCTITIAKD